MRAARVTVVVPCVCLYVCVCVSVHSFQPPRASRHRNIGMYVFTVTRKKLLYNRDLRMLGSEAMASFACLGCHQLHLNPKRRIPKESTEGWKAIDNRDFN